MSTDEPLSSDKSTISKWHYITMFVLCYVNLINYMDRLTLAGVLNDVEDNFNISNEEIGLMQTVFVGSYMIFAISFGYLGDRYSRRWIMAGGVCLWSLSTLWGSFTDENFGLFLCSRATFGIGEASFSVIGPTIISDLFTHQMRSKMLAIFYFAIPVGSGLGYITGSEAAKFAGDWRWALRVTPIMGAFAVILIIFAMIDPPRGESEGTSSLKATSYTEDLKDLLRNKTYMLSTLAFACVTFVTGALSWWGPNFIFAGLKVQAEARSLEMSEVTFIFGVITMLAGLLGVPLGYFLAQQLRQKYAQADPLICAFGLLVSAPLTFLTLVFAQDNPIACFTFLFFGQLFLNLNWPIIADILLWVVIPTRRSTAEAFQILLSHVLGYAISPYLIGVISDGLKSFLSAGRIVTDPKNSTLTMLQNATTISSLHSFKTSKDEAEVEDLLVTFQSLQYALFIAFVVEIIGGFFFLMSSWYIVADKAKCDDIIAESVSRSVKLLPKSPNKDEIQD